MVTVSTFSENDHPQGKLDPGPIDIPQRKQSHLDVCNSPENYSFHSGSSSGFESVHFIHEALPEISLDDIDTSCDFLGMRVSLPLFISCMTGGTPDGKNANHILAKAAQEKNIPVGIGSIRVLLEEPDLFEHFNIRSLAPDVPIMANISAVQVRNGDVDKLYSCLERLAVDACVIHLNPGQELFQPGGDRDFSGLLNAIEQAAKTCPVPIIVKETGCGISPSRIHDLLERDVRYVDIAGAGGTSWILVEACRLSKTEEDLAREFRSWGIPTALVLDAAEDMSGRILASGGIRTGTDIAKSIALGAGLAGIGTPFIQDVLSGDAPAVIRRIEGIEKTLKFTMLLTGSKTLADLKKAPVIRDPGFSQKVEALKLISAKTSGAQ